MIAFFLAERDARRGAGEGGREKNVSPVKKSAIITRTRKRVEKRNREQKVSEDILELRKQARDLLFPPGGTYDMDAILEFFNRHSYKLENLREEIAAGGLFSPEATRYDQEIRYLPERLFYNTLFLMGALLDPEHNSGMIGEALQMSHLMLNSPSCLVEMFGAATGFKDIERAVTDFSGAGIIPSELRNEALSVFPSQEQFASGMEKSVAAEARLLDSMMEEPQKAFDGYLSAADTLFRMIFYKYCIFTSFARPCARLVNSVSRTLAKPRAFCGNFVFFKSHSEKRMRSI